MNNGIYTFFQTHPDQEHHQSLLGRVSLNNNQIEHLEDYHDVLSELMPAGGIMPILLSRLQNLMNGSNPYFTAVNHNDWMEGKHPHLPAPPQFSDEPWENEEEIDGSPETKEPTIIGSYDYSIGDQPLQLDCLENGKISLQGHVIEDGAVQNILDSLDMGKAALRHREDLTKSSGFTNANLFKGLSTNLSDALDHVRSAVKSGHVHSDALKAIQRAIYLDPMVPSIGNKHAYHDMLTRHSNDGSHLVLDANNFKTINDKYGHAAGDAAIKSLFTAAREAADIVGKKHLKVFRTGGDEGYVHAATPEHGKQWAKVFKQKLDALPPINGVHKLSASVGMGSNPEQADRAMYMAKERKGASGLAPGQNSSYIHSLVSGHEGKLE